MSTRGAVDVKWCMQMRRRDPPQPVQGFPHASRLPEFSEGDQVGDALQIDHRIHASWWYNCGTHQHHECR